MREIWAIQTAKAWALSRSANSRGYPATHAFDVKDKRILCGVNLEDFDRVLDGSQSRFRKVNEVDLVNCVRCLDKLEDLKRNP